MARALPSDPKVLVLMQPDRRAWTCGPRRSLLGVVDRCAASGTGVLVVSDELDDLRICDRVLVMFHGRVVVRSSRAAGATTTWSPPWKESTRD